MTLELCGWVPNPKESEAFVASLPKPTFLQAAPQLIATGMDANVFLWECERKVLGRVLQAHEQKIGSCVSHSWGRGVQDLMLADIAVRNEPERWVAEVATEPIYAGSRVEIGRGQLGNEDGSLGAWAAKWVSQYGVLLRQKYGSIDLTTLDENRAKKWGNRGVGVPDELEPIAREHPVKTVTLVTVYEQARDAIANGYPVPVCSMQGFETTRDSQGFCRPKGTWAHAMLFRGCGIAKGNRPFLVCQQSWGESPDGNSKVRLENDNEITLPQGCFCVDAEVCDKMLASGDSFTISGFQGFPARTLPETWLC